MKVEDVPDEWVALGSKAHALYSPLLVAPMPARVPSREEMWEAQVRWIIAAVAPLIRRAALEEAAGVVGSGEYGRAGITIAAAIRALYATSKETGDEG
jgi:hypothetical protein